MVELLLEFVLLNDYIERQNRMKRASGDEI